MSKRISIGILCLLLMILGPACKKRSVQIDPEIANSDEALFRTGEQFIKKDPEKARLYLRQVIDSFPQSFFAQRAKLAIADSYFYQGDEGSMILAASEYRDFITNFPMSPSAPYAQLQIAMSFFKKVLKPGRDQTKTEQALQEFKRLITDYPLSEETKQARENVKLCEEFLAAHILNIGNPSDTVLLSSTSLLSLGIMHPRVFIKNNGFVYFSDRYLNTPTLFACLLTQSNTLQPLDYVIYPDIIHHFHMSEQYILAVGVSDAYLIDLQNPQTPCISETVGDGGFYGLMKEDFIFIFTPNLVVFRIVRIE